VIRIVITETTKETYIERVNYLVKSTPTEVKEEETDRYGGGTKRTVKCIEEYKTEDVTKERNVSTELLEQNVPSESFNLKAVIRAINGLT
jgi:hypothetical protein